MGNPVGRGVGSRWRVGDGVGLNVGRAVGAAVGLKVGDGIGPDAGRGVGCGSGCADGAPVGRGDGPTCGGADGASVGRQKSYPAPSHEMSASLGHAAQRGYSHSSDVTSSTACAHSTTSSRSMVCRCAEYTCTGSTAIATGDKTTSKIANWFIMDPEEVIAVMTFQHQLATNLLLLAALHVSSSRLCVFERWHSSARGTTQGK